MIFGEHLDRADALYDAKRLDLALAEYQKYLASEPNSDYAHCMIAMCLSDLGKHREALPFIEKALELFPENAHYFYTHSFVLQKLGRNAKAKESIERAIELAPEVALYHAEAGICLMNLDRDNEAEKESAIAIELHPDSAPIWYRRAVVLLSVNKLKQAHDAVDRALAIDPESALAHALKGVILVQENKFTDALRYYRESLRIDPNSEWARSGYMDALRARSPVYKILVFFSSVKVPSFFFFNIYIAVALLLIFLLLAVAAVLVKAISPHLLNVFLAFDPDGAQALEPVERTRAKVFALYVVASWFAGVWMLFHLEYSWVPATLLFVYAAPVLVTRIFEFEKHSKYRNFATIYAGAGLLLGAASAVTAALSKISLWDNSTPTWGISDTSAVLSFLFLVACLFSRQFWKEHQSFF